MVERNLGDDVRLECRLRLEALLRQADPCLVCINPDTLRLYTPSPSGIGEGYEIAVDELIFCPRQDGSQSRAWIVGAEEGRGHNSLAQHFAHIWCSKPSTVSSLQTYKGLLAFNSEQISSEGCWEAVKTFLPDTLARWGAPEFAEWMEESPVLIIIEDFDYRKCRDFMLETLEEWREADFLVLTSPSYIVDSAALFGEYLPTLKLTIADIESPTASKLKNSTLSSKERYNFCNWCEDNWSFTREILSYPVLLQPFCYAWKSKHINTSTKTTTQLLWNILEAHITKNLHMEHCAIEKWFLAVGQLARSSLEDKDRRPVQKAHVMNKAQNIFQGDFAKDLISSAIPCLSSWLCRSNIYFPFPIKQFLAAWEVINQLVNGASLKLLTKHLIDEDSVVLFTAGHLARILLLQPESANKYVYRCARHLISHMDRAKDRFVYTLRVINEFLVHPWILEAFKAEVVFSKHWEIHDRGISVLPIEALLQFDNPQKILLLLSKPREAPDLEGVVHLLANHSIPLALMESTHLQWESPCTTDKLIKILQRGKAVLQDFIGCLTCDTILSLGNFETTRYLVCIRARVTNLEAVQAFLDCPRHLPHLMWLEPDFDIPFRDLQQVQLPEVNTNLMDVCFKDISDDDIPLLCELLAHMRRHYSGLHLTRSTVSPQGVIDILKQFYKRGMKLTTDIKAVNRYRRWRFPALSSIHPAEEMTQERVQHLLGYDDRHHYNDNEVRSSALTSQKEAGVLVEFLKLMEDLLCFRYTCNNYIIIKHCSGIVEAKKLL
ncbi:hypothetical protein SK128_016307 [Halocaridina rubra]|uniref:Uncharacterized protein n=1 Tax=Halocaridina rubra TaxID=373956 RepID=A0AAN8WYL0_HALRR